MTITLALWLGLAVFLLLMDWIGELYIAEKRDAYRWYMTLAVAVFWPIWIPLWMFWKLRCLNPRYNGRWSSHD